MVDIEDIKSLESVDLNTYEVKIWKALLKKGAGTAGELSEDAQVPRSRSYDVLESLEKKGFVIMQLGKPIKYLALPPKEVLRRLQKNIERDTKQAIQKLEDLNESETIDKLKQLYQGELKTKNPSNILKHHTTPRRIIKHIKSLIESAEHTIKIASSTTDIYSNTAIVAPLRHALKKQVDVKILTKQEINNTLPDIKIKKHEKEETDFVLIDDKTAFIFITPTDSQNPTGMSVSAPFFIKSLSALFDEVWKIAEPQ